MSFFEGFDFTIELSDIGDTWQLEAIVIGDGKRQVLMELPFGPGAGHHNIVFMYPTTEQWEAWLKQSDHPVETIATKSKNGELVKAIIRKGERQVDEAIKWQVYARDTYTCRYCGRSGVPMTVDHYQPQALGGITTIENLRTSCRRCNKLKGDMPLDTWKILAASKGLQDGS